MARPLVVNDFMDTVNLTGSFSELQKVGLRKTFRRVVGRSLPTALTYTSATPVNVEGMSFNVRKGQTYRIQGRFPVSAAAGGVRAALTASGQTTPGLTLVAVGTLAASSIASITTSFGTSLTAAGTVLMLELDGSFTADGNGVVQLQLGGNTASSTTYAKAGWLQLIRVG